MDDLKAYSYAAPAVLVAHCRRSAPRASTAVIGSYDAGDVGALVQWLDDKDEFSTHDSWVSLGMAIKLEFGDSGLGLWRLAHNSTVTDSVEESKWNSFATDPKPGCVTLASIMKRAHALGWTGSIRASSSSMFDGVAQLAAATGATSKGAVPIFAGRGAAHVKLFSPILAAVPVLPRLLEHPELPDIGHPLRDAINAAIPGIIASPAEHVLAHAVINLLHPQTAEKVWPITPSLSARTAFLDAEEKQALKPNDWARDLRTQRIESDNVDNVEFYLNTLGIEYRWNAWFECIEIKGWKWPKWTRLDDKITTIIRVHATKTGTRFVMGKEFAFDSLLELSQRNVVDPACDLLARLESEWDGVARLDIWLCRACGVEDNAYHRAVSRTVLLGLVGRIRHPGIKFDLMMVLISPKQGTEKSSLAKVLALNNEWFVENVRLDMEPKELVLLLAGKTVAEVTEMRNHGDAEAAKAMISTTHDEGRTAYGRFTTRRARRNILIGSTNKPEFLEDLSGARRFLPVNVVGTIDLAWVKANLNQLVGEAAAVLSSEIEKHNGEKIELPPEVWDLAAEYQEAARAMTSVEEAISDWFDRDGHFMVLAGDIGRALNMAGFKAAARYGVYMERLGWKRDQMNSRDRTRVWIKPGAGERISLEPVQNGINARVEMRMKVIARMGLPPLPY